MAGRQPTTTASSLHGTLPACPNIDRSMSDPISTSDLLKGDLSRHSPSMAHHPGAPVFA